MTAFSPTDNRPPPVIGDELVTLEPVLMVLRATYFDPVLESDRPLPPHRWALWHPDRFAESTTSDDDGVCLLPAPALDDVGPDDEWVLVLIPVFDDVTQANQVAVQGYGFLDVDEHRWLADEPEGPIHETRWLRLPAWTSSWKAREGGFVELYPHDPDFADAGIIRTKNLRRHGTAGQPWNVRIDHGWPRSYVAFHYHDHQARALQNVPQGLALEVRDPDDAVVGQSTCLVGEAIYVVQMRGKANDAFHYRWRLATTESHSIHLAQRRIEPCPHELSQRPTHRALPPAWGSRAQMPWHGGSLPSPTLRKTFGDLRSKPTTRDNPLRFHLDDIVLTRSGKTIALVGGEEQGTAFDHHLAIKDPAPNPTGGTQPFSTMKVKALPLLAEEFYATAGDDLATTTRLLEYDGSIYDLGDTFITPPEKKPPPKIPPGELFDGGVSDTIEGEADCEYLGLRNATFLRTQVNNVGAAFLGPRPTLIDTSYIQDSYAGKPIQPYYLLFYLPYHVDIAKHGATTQHRDACQRMLAVAARRWNNKYPGDPDTPSPREVVALPDTGQASGPTPAIRLRCHLGLAREARGKSIFIHPDKGRADSEMNLFAGSGHLGLSGPVRTDFDGNAERSLMIAHEFGHNMLVTGLPDEYINYIDIPEWGNRSPAIATATKQHTGWQPFARDQDAIMVKNRFQRLRYLWFLHDEDAVNDLLGDTRRIVYEWSGGTLEYRPPLMPEHTFVSPWEPVATDTFARAKTALFATPDDGGTLAPLRGGMGEEPIQGIVAINVRTRFEFPEAMSDGEVWDCVADAWTTLFQPGSRVARKAFFWSNSDALHFRRVLVEIQWYVDITRHPHHLDDGTLISFVTPDVTVRVHQNGSPPQTNGSVIDVDEDDVGAWLLRYALGSTILNDDGWSLEDVAHLQPHIAQLCRESDGVLSD